MIRNESVMGTSLAGTLGYIGNIDMDKSTAILVKRSTTWTDIAQWIFRCLPSFIHYSPWFEFQAHTLCNFHD